MRRRPNFSVASREARSRDARGLRALGAQKTVPPLSNHSEETRDKPAGVSPTPGSKHANGASCDERGGSQLLRAEARAAATSAPSSERTSLQVADDRVADREAHCTARKPARRNRGLDDPGGGRLPSGSSDAWCAASQVTLFDRRPTWQWATPDAHGCAGSHTSAGDESRRDDDRPIELIGEIRLHHPIRLHKWQEPPRHAHRPLVLFSRPRGESLLSLCSLAHRVASPSLRLRPMRDSRPDRSRHVISTCSATRGTWRTRRISLRTRRN